LLHFAGDFLLGEGEGGVDAGFAGDGGCEVLGDERAD
jgi:hypothetical protein